MLILPPPNSLSFSLTLNLPHRICVRTSIHFHPWVILFWELHFQSLNVDCPWNCWWSWQFVCLNFRHSGKWKAAHLRSADDSKFRVCWVWEGTADEVYESLLCCFPCIHEGDENIERGYEAFPIWTKKEHEIVLFLACLIIEGTKEETRRHWTAVKKMLVKIFDS